MICTTRKQASKKINERFLSVLNERFLSVLIEHCIVNQCEFLKSGYPVVVKVPAGTFSDYTIETVLTKYRKAGWCVNIKRKIPHRNVYQNVTPVNVVLEFS